MGRLSRGAAVLFVALVGCASEGTTPLVRPRVDPGRQLALELGSQRDHELRERIPTLRCRGEDGDPGAYIVEDEAWQLDQTSSTTQLRYAERALRCTSPEAALIVFRVVPVLLFERLYGKDIASAYAFLARDRAHALALLRVLLSSGGEAVHGALGVQHPELARDFDPEAILDATCDELDGMTPHFGVQLAYLYEVLERRHCGARLRELLERSLRGSTYARLAACELAERAMPELEPEMVTAAATDPGAATYAPIPHHGPPPRGVVATILSGLVDGLRAIGRPREVIGMDHVARGGCARAVERLRARR